MSNVPFFFYLFFRVRSMRAMKGATCVAICYYLVGKSSIALCSLVRLLSIFNYTRDPNHNNDNSQFPSMHKCLMTFKPKTVLSHGENANKSISAKTRWLSGRQE